MNFRLRRHFLRHSVPMLLSILVLGFGAIGLTTRFLVTNQKKAAINRLEQIQAYFEVVLEEMDSLNIMFSTNAEIVNKLKFILGSSSWSLEDTRDIRTIRSYISAISSAREHIDSIYIYQENVMEKVLSSFSGAIPINEMSDQKWYKSYLEQDPKIEAWTESRTFEKTSSNDEEYGVITFYRTIYNGSGKRTGVMVLNLLKNKLINNNLQFFLFGKEKVIILDDLENVLIDLGNVDINRTGNTIKFSKESSKFGWKFNLYYRTKDLYQLPIKISIFTAILSVLAVLLGLVATFKTNQKERLFLERTLELLEDAKGEKIDTSTDEKNKNMFDFMTDNILQKFIEQDYLKIRKEAMEYRALQMQINPHFLFNTLETINWRAIKQLKGENDISKMISLMSKILKYSMYINDDISVNLEEEILHSKYYLEIQKIRFANKFNVEWEIDESLLKFQIPRLILQPILENCFTHAITDSIKVLNIVISVIKVDKFVYIVIKDNGKGSDTNLKICSKGDENFRSEHIGLHNVQKRLYLFFKNNVEIRINSQEGCGTEVKFILPGNGLVSS